VDLGSAGRLYDRTIERALALHPVCVTTVAVSALKALCERPGVEFLEEPVPRNTAPAIALAALHAERHTGPDGGLLIMPADHFIEDIDNFVSTVYGLAGLCHEEQALGVMGIRPTGPSSAYGYVTPGEAAGDGFRLGSFVEKPDRDKALRLIEEGASWNSGIFYFPLRVFKREMGKYCNDCLEAASVWLRGGDKKPYEALNGDSIDYALMENSRKVVMVEAGFSWSDVGAYPALHALLPKDDYGNSGWGPGAVVDCRNCLVVTSRRESLVKGFEHCVVVEGEEGFLSVPLDEADKIRHDVESILTAEGDDRPAVDIAREKKK